LSIKNYISRWLIKKQLRKISSSNKPIIAGPWLSEVGFEILYWIPFLNWAIENYRIDAKRIIVVSRGGAQQWYRGLGEKYIDVFDYLNSEDFKLKNNKRINDAGMQKQIVVSEFEKQIVQLIKEALNIKTFDWLHPLVMYRLFMPCWEAVYPVSFVAEHTHYKRCRLSLEEPIKNLPDTYVAVKFYFNNSFPDIPENRVFISELLKTLAQRTRIVLLCTGLDIDDHNDYDSVAGEYIHIAKDSITPRNNLDIQTQLIANSSMFVGTYGGFSYIAPFYNVPSVAFYSHEDKFFKIHLDIAHRAYHNIKSNKEKYAPGLTALDVKNFNIVKHLLDFP
jgi:hypothetical protein